MTSNRHNTIQTTSDTAIDTAAASIGLSGPTEADLQAIESEAAATEPNGSQPVSEPQIVTEAAIESEAVQAVRKELLALNRAANNLDGPARETVMGLIETAAAKLQAAIDATAIDMARTAAVRKATEVATAAGLPQSTIDAMLAAIEAQYVPTVTEAATEADDDRDALPDDTAEKVRRSTARGIGANADGTEPWLTPTYQRAAVKAVKHAAEARSQGYVQKRGSDTAGGAMATAFLYGVVDAADWKDLALAIQSLDGRTSSKGGMDWQCWNGKSAKHGPSFVHDSIAPRHRVAKCKDDIYRLVRTDTGKAYHSEYTAVQADQDTADSEPAVVRTADKSQPSLQARTVPQPPVLHSLPQCPHCQAAYMLGMTKCRNSACGKPLPRD